VADLAGAAAPLPQLPVEHHAAADAGAPEHAEDRPERPAGAELELRVGGDVDVVGEPDRSHEGGLQLVGERVRSLPAGQVAGAGDGPGLVVDDARRADTDRRQVARPRSGLVRRLAQRRDQRERDLGRTAVRRRRVARRPEHLVGVVRHHGLDLGPA
jgi:hypothetical protein